MKKQNPPYPISSISEQHRCVGLPKPKHPMISVFRFEEMTNNIDFEWYMLGFYCISIKRNFTGKMKYGQSFYDHDEGIMAFMSPNQLLSLYAEANKL